MNKIQNYQDKLASLLDSDLSAAQIQKALVEDPDLNEFRNYVQSFDLAMIEIAKELVNKWSKRASQN